MCQFITPECQTHPPTRIFDANCGWEDRYAACESPLKTSRPSFCVILKLSHEMVCSVCYLVCMVVNIFLLNEGSLNVTTFRLLSVCCCLGFFLAWNSLGIYFQCCDGHFPCFGKYIFPQLQTCSADCTKGSCSSNT